MRYSKKEIIQALVVFGLGIGVATLSVSYKKEQTGEEKAQESYNHVVKNECYLDGWLVQNIQIENRENVHTKSDLPIEKYNAGLNVRFLKRLISEDGKQYSETTSKDAKFVTFEKTRYFVYTCKNDEKYKSLFGFFDRTKGTPQT